MCKMNCADYHAGDGSRASRVESALLCAALPAGLVAHRVGRGAEARVAPYIASALHAGLVAQAVASRRC